MSSANTQNQEGAVQSGVSSALCGTSTSVSTAEDLSQPPGDDCITVELENGFIAVTSSRSMNHSRRNSARAANRSHFQRGASCPRPKVYGNTQLGDRKPGIQPMREGQVPTSLRSRGGGALGGTPLYPLQPMQFPLPGYDFRLACLQCFKSNSIPNEFSHTCRQDFLIVCNMKNVMRRWRLVRVPGNPFPVKSYLPCQRIFNGLICPRGDRCWFAHNEDERRLWNWQNQGSFRIADFIASNRRSGRLSEFTVEAVFNKFPGTLDVICKACFQSNRFFEPQNPTRETCSKELHDLKSLKVLAHRDAKTGRVTIIERCPFKGKTAFFNYCHYGNFCRKSFRCSFAHSTIEYDLWYVQRDSGLSEEQILTEWQRLSNSLKTTGQWQKEQTAGQWQKEQTAGQWQKEQTAGQWQKEQTAGQWQKELQPSTRSVSESNAGDLVPSYSSVAARKLSVASESAVGMDTSCPFSITTACAICIHAGHLSGKAGDRCARGHQWELNRVYVTLPSKKEVRRVPQEILKRRKAKFYLCRMAKSDCRYGSQCQRAHNDIELRLWTWMAANNVNSIESIVRSTETLKPTMPSSSSSSLSLCQQNDVSASGEGPWFPRPPQPAEWVCDFCSYSCSSHSEYLRHLSNVTHQFNVNSDKELQWNFRQPPWNVRGGLYRLCSRHEDGKSCRYSHVSQNHNYCTFAHGTDELDEWKERFKWREMKKKAAQEDSLYSYMTRLITEYKESGCAVISEEAADVTVECSDPLSVTAETKLKVKEWTFVLHSQVHDLQTVALLYEEGFLHFALIGEDLEENCQIADGEVFQTEDTEYKVKVRFTGGLFGSFHQWVVFDFGVRPVVVRKLSVELGQKLICEKLLVLKDEMKFSRWTSLNRRIVKFSSDSYNPEGFASELLARYKEPNVDTIRLQQISQTPLNINNYKHRMHGLINLEELAQAKIISSSSCYEVVRKITVTNCISDEWGGMQFSQSGQLFAKVDLDARLLEGSLISSSSVSTALIGSANGRDGDTVYEAKICRLDKERELKGRDHIYLTLTKSCCEEMNLKHGQSVEAEIQFQMDRLTFCRMHYAIDRLDVVDAVFPDSKCIATSSAWNSKYWIDLSSSELNEDQKKVIEYVSIRRKQLTQPLVVYGPFGTGKTKTLAEAALLLTSKNPDAKVLICAWTNHAADEYILRHFHPKADPLLRLLRIYDKYRHVSTVNRLILPYSLLSFQGNTECFQEPTLADIRSRRIIVTTVETSLVLTRLGLHGHFTHIFVDEAAQAHECHTIMPLCLADEKTCVVLAGDHIQMTQKVYSTEAIRQNFHVSLVERMLSGYFGLPQSVRPVVLFGSNYRNHPEIVRFVGRIFYGGERSLRSLGFHATSAAFPPLAFCAALNGKEEQHSSSTSFYNAAEIYEVVERVDQMLRRWPSEWGEKRPEDILVTTAYTDQVAMIRYMLRKHSNRDLYRVVVLKVQNVPGKEYRAVFISTVRTAHLLADSDSNNDLSYGFLSDEKLLNSALTRARSTVIVIGDPIALCGVGSCSKIWREYVKQCSRLNGVTPRGLDINWVRLQVIAATRNLETGNTEDAKLEEEPTNHRSSQSQEEDWGQEFQLPEDEITRRLQSLRN